MNKLQTAQGELPLPAHYDPSTIIDDQRWINYPALQHAATEWRRQHTIPASATDRFKIGVLAIDVQNTFCHPSGELYVAGHSGTGAIDDSRRLIEFGYRNLGLISGWECTLDTHRAYAIFHPSFLIDGVGNYPAPFTMISHKDVVEGAWMINPLAASSLGVNLMTLQQHLEHYTKTLEGAGRYALTIWPYHGMLGDKGHNLVSGLVELTNFHGLVRGTQPGFEVKGTNPLVENYSVLGPEVTTLFDGTPVPRNTGFIEKLLRYDALVVAGQAKSHCVAWTIADLLDEILRKDPSLARKVYILEDCSTSIVVKAPDGTVVYDYGPEADKAFDEFRSAGMHLVKSTDPIETWDGITL